MNKNILAIILFFPLVFSDEEGPLPYPEPLEGWEEGDFANLFKFKVQ